MHDGRLSTSSCLVVGLHIYKVLQPIVYGKENGGIYLRLTVSLPILGAPTKIKTRKTHGYNNKDEQSLGVDSLGFSYCLSHI